MTNDNNKQKRQPTNGNGSIQRYEMDMRLDFIEQLLASGNRPRATATLAMKEYGISRSTAENYVKRVYARWAEEGIDTRPESRREAIERIREVFRRSLKKDDFGNAGRMAELLAKIDGVDPGVNVNLKQTGTVEVKLEAGDKLTKVVETLMSDPVTKKKFIDDLNSKGEAEAPGTKRRK